MSRRSISLGLGLLLLLPVLAVAADSEGRVTLSLPQGDPEAGRVAFTTLPCSKCHAVAGDETLPHPQSDTPGPTLGPYQADQAASRLGMSIFSPSHEITAVVRGSTDGVSPMPDLTNTITVRQFVDLIAFLQSLEE